MPLDTTDNADTINRFGWRPDDLAHSMIRANDSYKIPLLVFADRPVSFGALNRLPLEILHTILNLLDLQTISRISRVSAHGLSIVQSLPAYRELTRHAPSAINALSRMKLLGLHSISQLRRALRSTRCLCCPEYGAYLFLPTCVRCCWECLRLNPSLRAISPTEVKRYFGLKDQHVAELPVFYTIPANYIFSHNTKSIQVSNKLISATAAKELGRLVHGSVEGLSTNLTKRLKAPKSRVIGRFLQAASTTPHVEDPLAGPWQGNVPPDDFFGMSTIPFPSLQGSGDIDHGLWCRGCSYTFEHRRDLDSVDLATIVPPGCCPDRVLHGLSRRARSKAGFLEHVGRCYGVRKANLGR